MIVRTPGRTRRLILLHLGILAVLIGYLLLTNLAGIGCPIRTVTGIPCPACGTTRAWWLALHGDLKQALFYHPLFWLLPPLLFLGIHRNTRILRWLPSFVGNLLLIGGSVAVFLCWIFRLAGPGIP